MNTLMNTLITQVRESDPEQQRQGALALAESARSSHRQEAVGALCALLDHDLLDVRETAKQALIKIGGQDVVERIIPLLTSSSTTALNYAVDILSKIGGDGIDAILDLLNSKDHDVRKFGCDILGNLHYRESVYELLELLNDPHINVAIAAGEALGKLGNAEAVPHLIRLLHHPDTWMRCIAVEALGKIGDPRAVDALLAIPGSEEPIMLYTIIKALGNLHDPRVLPYILAALREHAKFAASAAQAIESLAAQQGDDVYEHIRNAGVADLFLPLLSSEHEEILQNAIHLIGKLRVPGASQPLQHLLQHQNTDIVAGAAAALLQIEPPETLRPIIQELLTRASHQPRRQLLQYVLDMMRRNKEDGER